MHVKGIDGINRVTQGHVPFSMEIKELSIAKERRKKTKYAYKNVKS